MAAPPARPVVVLDLNGCLLSLESRRHPDRAPDFAIGRRHVYLRPGVAEFLASLDRLGCDCAVWTSRPRHNAAPIVARLPFARPPAFVYCREQCDPGSAGPYSTVKDLSRIASEVGPGRPYVVLDDSPHKFLREHLPSVHLVASYGAACLLDDRELLESALPALERWQSSLRAPPPPPSTARSS